MYYIIIIYVAIESGWLLKYMYLCQKYSNLEIVPSEITVIYQLMMKIRPVWKENESLLLQQQ